MTQIPSPIRQRNQAMELFKLIASVLVVFIHVEFPGQAGSMVVSLAQIAVPIFFAISGWFSYRTSADRLLKRLVHIIFLFITAIVIAAVLGSLVVIGTGGSVPAFLRGFVPGTENLAKMMLLHDSSFPGTGYTWYLIGAGVCYLILYVYVRFFGEEEIRYQPLYIFSAVLFVANFQMAEMPRAMGAEIPYQFYRNGLFLGLPLFTLGIFLREHRERIMKNFALTSGKLSGLCLLGIAVTLLQWKGVGTGALPPGTVIQTAALMLLLANHGDLKFPGAVSLGEISTVVYLIHYPLIGVYETFLQPLVPMDPGAESWLRPVFVAGLSIAAGAVWLLVKKAAKKCRK